ncbi:MAG: hypothetical protein ACI9FN_000629 [Saprospiraceae bacterium]|jgi:hypothetical protein
MDRIFKCNVIASHVSNLTDARYFAARGVDYLLYDLDEISLAQIAEIQEWVSGPEALLLFSNNSIGQLDEAMIKLSPFGISTKDDFTAIGHLNGHTEIFEWSMDQIELQGMEFNDFDHYTPKNDQGVFVRGGLEAAVGIKSYDELDEILDTLEN